jgi:Putative phage serine protease XkdF
MPEQRFIVALAYQAGRDPLIQKGMDGGRDYFTPEQLEKAADSFARNGMGGGTFHIDGTDGEFEPTRSWIHLGPDWTVTGPDGSVTVVKAGDWLVGGYLSPHAWALYKRGLVTGLSPQGSARRITAGRA